ncbi:uncharacterized protein N0V89_012160 [Didymosphaeria variabile]|uniref:Uncharacterized protein n=1 Tax=Didymosphaeria variabile TaxID=1932322 RepID=A0A9W8X8V5_9PLEO|nr:uncharacterized protein N0V89_012160 [Didymosphaeria variabile]KAJ4344418.1 hypothetical protein N0V89_012160 [Didymosphaeria variabile]
MLALCGTWVYETSKLSHAQGDQTALWLSLVDIVSDAAVIEDVTALDAELGEEEEPEEAVDAAVDAAVDDALAAHEACVGTSTPYALQRPLASVMIA